MPTFTNVVQETTDYDKFNLLNANREVTRGHVESLKRAFEEQGNLTAVQPILVNDRYEIIDGQHRFVACKEMGLPIFYTMAEGLNVNDARSMNVLHKQWTTDDYANSYADTGSQEYIKYLQLYHDYGFNHGITLAYIYNGATTGKYKKFRQGQLVIEDLNGTKERLNRLAEVGEITELVRNRPFAIALLKAMKAPEYDHRRMVRKLRLHGDSHLKWYSSVEDNSRMLEHIYNIQITEHNRVRLF